LIKSDNFFGSKLIKLFFPFTIGWFMMFDATFNNISAISWQSVLLVEETEENHRPAANP
jgi:hypothetical protein